MPLSNTSLDELRSECKHRIESLELWLRRLVDDKLSGALGTNYFDVQLMGNYIFPSKVRQDAQTKLQQNSNAHLRLIDMLYLKDLVNVLCKEDLFQKYFREALKAAFPDGRAEARTFFTRLVDIRHLLSHANPISSHQASRVFCYVGDIVNSIQEHYVKIGLGDEFNAPHFVEFRDSNGHRCSISQTQERFDFTDTNLRVGDKIRLEVDTDDLGGDSKVQWVVANISQGESGVGTDFTIELMPRHVGMNFTIAVSLISVKDWHRHQNFDASLSITYKVLPLPR